MKYGSTILLLLAVLGLGAYIWFVERKGETTERREEQARYALKVDASAVTRFSVATDTMQITCEKEGRQWVLAGPPRTRADGGTVERLLEELERLPKGEVISADEQSRAGLGMADYGFDRPRVRITLGGDSFQTIILVGADAKLGDALYVKEEGRPDIVSTTTNILNAVPRSVTEIRDRRLFEGFPSDATRITIRRSDGFMELAKSPEDASWGVQKPVRARAAAASVQALLDALYEVRVSEFIADSVAAASLYGLDEPAVEVAVLSRGGEQTLLLGRNAGRSADQVYATLQGADEVFSVPTNILGVLQVKLDALRDRRVVTLPAYDIGYIEMQEGERTLKLAMTGGTWRAIEPKQFVADEERVQVVLSEWTGAKIAAFNDEPVTNMAEVGLAPPARRLVLARGIPAPLSTNAAPGAPGEVTSRAGVSILVSAVSAGHDRFMVYVEGEPSLYLVDAAPVHAISVDPVVFRDRHVLSIEPADVLSISVQTSGVEQVVERDSTNSFRAAGGAVKDVDLRGVDALLRAVKSLRAVDLIVEDSPDLGPFGLAEPRATITLGLSADAGLGKSLLLGGEAGEGYVYAMIKGQDVVFTLEKALAETFTTALYKDASSSELITVESPLQKEPAGP
jgi:hypothetical protein